MQMISFSAVGWESWDVSRQPLIRDRMPVLVDDDLCFEDSPGVPRPALIANRWLRELPMNGAPAVRTWQNNAGCLRDWLQFLKDRGVDPLGDRHDLHAALSMYAEYRFAGELENRWDVTTWNLHVGILSSFYRWARDEGLAVAVPFTYRAGKKVADGVLVEVERNLAKLRTPRPHTSVKYLERDFSELFVRALAGLDAHGEPDRQYRGREGARNSSMAGLVLSSGLRGQEFTYLTVHEVPPLPARPSPVPVLFPLAHAVTKTVSYVVITRWSLHGAGYVELDCSGGLVGARQAVDSGGSGAAAGRRDPEHA
ncbi:hypothetical protein OG864_00590 [Streptomyces sp. NBC_00124]|uniref:hypothetical protein n=1 Tax=Streptomyces sp. NBC_00124 TaxID=2975662 RepID=UPI00224CB52C|nr:hypothetical protein [Streptomyces sp. NBC_00124]MCX5357280.1 hypothetical protein [Streptomyces sp. NBC_00124]